MFRRPLRIASFAPSSNGWTPTLRKCKMHPTACKVNLHHTCQRIEFQTQMSPISLMSKPAYMSSISGVRFCGVVLRSISSVAAWIYMHIAVRAVLITRANGHHERSSLTECISSLWHSQNRTALGRLMISRSMKCVKSRKQRTRGILPLLLIR